LCVVSFFFLYHRIFGRCSRLFSHFSPLPDGISLPPTVSQLSQRDPFFCSVQTKAFGLYMSFHGLLLRVFFFFSRRTLFSGSIFFLFISFTFLALFLSPFECWRFFRQLTQVFLHFFFFRLTFFNFVCSCSMTTKGPPFLFSRFLILDPLFRLCFPGSSLDLPYPWLDPPQIFPLLNFASRPMRVEFPLFFAVGVSFFKIPLSPRRSIADSFRLAAPPMLPIFFPWLILASVLIFMEFPLSFFFFFFELFFFFVLCSSTKTGLPPLFPHSLFPNCYPISNMVFFLDLRLSLFFVTTTFPPLLRSFSSFRLRFFFDFPPLSDTPQGVRTVLLRFLLLCGYLALWWVSLNFRSFFSSPACRRVIPLNFFFPLAPNVLFAPSRGVVTTPRFFFFSGPSFFYLPPNQFSLDYSALTFYKPGVTPPNFWSVSDHFSGFGPRFFFFKLC